MQTTHHKAHHIDTPDDAFASSCLQKYYILPASVGVHPPAETMDPDEPERRRLRRFTVTSMEMTADTSERSCVRRGDGTFHSALAVHTKAKCEDAAAEAGVCDNSH